MKQTLSTILASVMAVLAFDSTIVTADESTLRGSRDESTRSLSSSYLDTVIRNLGYVGSSHPETNPEARATHVSRSGTGMPMTIHLHQEGKPVMEVLQELLQELPLMTHE